MSRAHLDTVENRDYASCARASSGVFARTEQHVGQLFDGTPSPGRRRSTITRCEPPRPMTERSSASAGLLRGRYRHSGWWVSSRFVRDGALRPALLGSWRRLLPELPRAR
jgi:hypothetical protein